jgi:hypothetical protein
MAAFFALVGHVVERSIHTLNGDPLPHPDVVVVETNADGTFMFRYTRDGQFGGDTWHETIAGAMSQAKQEYGDGLGEWVEIPADNPNAEAYALTAAVSARNHGD